MIGWIRRTYYRELGRAGITSTLNLAQRTCSSVSSETGYIPVACTLYTRKKNKKEAKKNDFGMN